MPRLKRSLKICASETQVQENVYGCQIKRGHTRYRINTSWFFRKFQQIFPFRKLKNNNRRVFLNPLMKYVLEGIIYKDLNANPSNPRLVSRQHHANHFM